MASSQTIKDSLISTIKALNPTIDTTKGPVYDLLLRPVPDELSGPSQDVESIKTLYSTLIASDSNNTAQIDTLGRAFRVSKPTGQRAKCNLVFWFTSLPQQDIVIPAGTAVATQDRRVVYTTTSDIQGINAQTAYSYYNTSTGRYEVYSDAVATQDGQDYEVPAFRLTLLLSRLQGISGVYNPVPGTGGVSAGSTDTYLASMQKRFLGRDSSSFASMEAQALELYPEVVLNTINSSDRLGFRRYVRGDGFDVIVGTPNQAFAEETFQVNNSLEFTPMRQPVLSVSDVYLNGSRLPESDYVFIVDTAQETSASTQAHNRIKITRALKTSDTLRIRHTYCSYCWGLQNQVFFSNADDFFGSDGLVRLAVPADVYVDLSIQTGSVNSDLQSSLVSYITGYVNTLGFTPVLSFSDLEASLLSTYTEIRSIRINSFRRLINAVSEIETSIDFLGYEIPQLLSSNLQVKISG